MPKLSVKTLRRSVTKERKYYLLFLTIILTVAFFAFLVMFLVPDGWLAVDSIPIQKTDKVVATSGVQIYKTLTRTFPSIPQSLPPRHGNPGQIALDGSNLLIMPATVKGLTPSPRIVEVKLSSSQIQIEGSIYPGNRFWCFTIIDGVSLAIYNQDGFVSNDNLSRAKCFDGVAYDAAGQPLP